MGFINIKGMHFYSYHGFYEEEQKLGNSFYVDLRIEIDLESSGLNDNLNQTINYSDLYNIVSTEMQQRSKLIENIAYRILNKIKESFPQISYINVIVHKPNPPIAGKIDDIFVEIEKRYD